jgi:hypothetical protein
MGRYNYRHKYYKSFYDSHTYNSYQDEIKSFIKKEFFLIDKIAFNKIADLYHSFYGDKPYNYLLEAYAFWKNGSRRVSDQTMEKILKCVPKYLTKDKKLIILKLEIIQFIERSKKKFENQKINCNQIDGIYTGFYDSVEKFDISDLRWFIKDVFSTNEIRFYIEISKYVIKKKLEQSYNQVKNDLKILHPIISQISFGVESQEYNIDFFKTPINLSSIQDIRMQFDLGGIKEPLLNENVDERMLNYLLDEILKITYIHDVGAINQEISKNDLNLLLIRYKDILDNDKEAEILSEFKGRGGIFITRILLKSKTKLSHALVLSICKTIAFSLGVIFVLFLYLNFGIFNKGGFFIVLFIVITVFLVYNFYKEYIKSKLLRMEVIKYGRRQ